MIAAGVAIFLFGMLSLEEGFRSFTGGTLERMLRRTTSSTGKSVLFGIVSTTLMQSSSLVSVIAISFLSAGLITLAAGIGIIFGANLGTTTGAWLIAGFGLKVDIAAYAMPLLAFGVILIFQSSKSLKGIGYILAGMGFLFLGIHYMKEGFETFKETINLAEYAVAGYPGLLLFTAIGIFATVVMQSSHATLVLTITALAAGQITYENALALAIYSAIVAFISETAFSRREEQSADLQWLREANTRLVEAVKDTGQLQENLVRYVGSDNLKMREVYNRIRVQLGLIVRDLEEMRTSDSGVLDVLSLDALKLLVDEDQQRINQIMTELIGTRAITPAMGSSLINDSLYAHDIAMNVIRAAQTLFVAQEHDLTQAAHDVVLDKGELKQIGV